MSPSPNTIDNLSVPTIEEKSVALVIDEKIDSSATLRLSLEGKDFRVVCGESIEVLDHLQPDTDSAVRSLAVSSTLPGLSAGELEQRVRSLFPMAPMIVVGDRLDAKMAWEDAMIVARLARPIDQCALDKAVTYCRRFVQTFEEILHRHLFQKHPVYVEEPIARVIHDINNQLTGLKGGIDLLGYSVEMIRDPETQARLTRYVERFIQPSLSQIEQLVGNWRHLRESRFRALTAADLVQIARQAIATAASPLQQRRIALTVESKETPLSADLSADFSADPSVGARPYWVKANPGQLTLALSYVLQNALEATENGKDGKILVEIDRTDEEMIRLSIFDNGDGVPESLRSLIWRSFFTTKGEGRSGLGLSIAKQLVDKHQGQIEYVPSPLGGAGFQILMVGMEAGASADSRMRMK